MSLHSIAFEFATKVISKSILGEKWMEFHNLYDILRPKCRDESERIHVLTFYMQLYHLNIFDVPYNWLRCNVMQTHFFRFRLVQIWQCDVLEHSIISFNRCWSVLVCVSTMRTLFNWFLFHFFCSSLDWIWIRWDVNENQCISFRF